MRAILALFGVVCLITGCGEGDSSEVPSTAPETGHESASAACTGFVEALNGQRWDAVASAISPSQRGAVAVWLSKGVRNMLAILEMTAEPKPTVDPAAANKQAQDIWTSAGVDAASFHDLWRALGELKGPSGLSELEGLAGQHLGGADIKQLIAKSLEFERKLMKDADESDATWAGARVVTPDQMANAPAGDLAEAGLELADRMVASASGILKAVQVGDTWFMSVVLNP